MLQLVGFANCGVQTNLATALVDQSTLRYRGAQILIVGSTRQAGAVIVMLRAGEQGNRILGEDGQHSTPANLTTQP
jgi:hypothetical protein